MIKKKKGMSLVEVVAALAIFSIVVVSITSIMLLSVKVSSNNRIRFQSNANSRMFIETQKVKDNRPEKYVPATAVVTKTGIAPGNYYIGFKDDAKVSGLAKDLSIKVPTKALNLSDPAPTIAELTGISGIVASDDKYAMAIRIQWNAIEQIYIMDIWSWDIAKGDSSGVNRRVLIAPK